jgi:hypothetical protein
MDRRPFRQLRLPCWLQAVPRTFLRHLGMVFGAVSLPAGAGALSVGWYFAASFVSCLWGLRFSVPAAALALGPEC